MIKRRKIILKFKKGYIGHHHYTRQMIDLFLKNAVISYYGYRPDETRLPDRFFNLRIKTPEWVAKPINRFLKNGFQFMFG